MGNPNHTDLKGLVIECKAVSTDGGTTSLATATLPSVSATTGSFPTPGGSTLFANTATPTVVELLDAIVELRAALVTAGVLK